MSAAAPVARLCAPAMRGQGVHGTIWRIRTACARRRTVHPATQFLTVAATGSGLGLPF